MVHPGVIATGLSRHVWFLTIIIHYIMYFFLKSAEQVRQVVPMADVILGPQTMPAPAVWVALACAIAKLALLGVHCAAVAAPEL